MRKTETKHEEETRQPEAKTHHHKSMTDAEMKAWVRREIGFAAVGHTVEEREKENP